MNSNNQSIHVSPIRPPQPLVIPSNGSSSSVDTIGTVGTLLASAKEDTCESPAISIGNLFSNVHNTNPEPQDENLEPYRSQYTAMLESDILEAIQRCFNEETCHDNEQVGKNLKNLSISVQPSPTNSEFPLSLENHQNNTSLFFRKTNMSPDLLSPESYFSTSTCPTPLASPRSTTTMGDNNDHIFSFSKNQPPHAFQHINLPHLQLPNPSISSVFNDYLYTDSYNNLDSALKFEFPMMPLRIGANDPVFDTSEYDDCIDLDLLVLQEKKKKKKKKRKNIPLQGPVQLTLET